MIYIYNGGFGICLGFAKTKDDLVRAILRDDGWVWQNEYYTKSEAIRGIKSEITQISARKLYEEGLSICEDKYKVKAITQRILRQHLSFMKSARRSKLLGDLWEVFEV